MFWSYVPLILAAFPVVLGVGPLVTLPKGACVKPRQPLLVTAVNKNDTFIDDTSYTVKSMSLPLKCVSEDYMLEDESASAKCLNQTWQKPVVKCIPIFLLKQRETRTIMIICGVVFGTLAATFVIVKVILYRRGRRNENKAERRLHNGTIELRRRDAAVRTDLDGTTTPTWYITVDNLTAENTLYQVDLEQGSHHSDDSKPWTRHSLLKQNRSTDL